MNRTLTAGLLALAGCAFPLVACAHTGSGAALSAVFALFHGTAHRTELAGSGAALAIAGMVVATALLHGAGIVRGLALRWTEPLAGAPGRCRGGLVRYVTVRLRTRP